MWAERQPKTSLKWPNSQKLEQKFAFSRAMLLAWNLTFASLMWTCQNSIKPTPKLSNGTGVKVSRKGILFSCTVFSLVVRSSQRSGAACPPGMFVTWWSIRSWHKADTSEPLQRRTHDQQVQRSRAIILEKKWPDGAAAVGFQSRLGKPLSFQEC